MFAQIKSLRSTAKRIGPATGVGCAEASRIENAPKVHLRDSGLLHSLLQIETLADLQSNPRYGAPWEGFAIEQICSVLGLEPDET